jgi:pimeloyl-ACP methyl ester carboxylesterase
VNLQCERFSGLSKQNTLFIHGNLASTDWWKPALKEWKTLGPAGNGAILLADWRGCGKNPDWPAGKPFSIKDLAQDFLALLREQKMDEVAVVGHSLGGLIALQMMILEPRRMSRAVFLDPVGARGVVFDESMY